MSLHYSGLIYRRVVLIERVHVADCKIGLDVFCQDRISFQSHISDQHRTGSLRRINNIFSYALRAQLKLTAVGRAETEMLSQPGNDDKSR